MNGFFKMFGMALLGGAVTGLAQATLAKQGTGNFKKDYLPAATAGAAMTVVALLMQSPLALQPGVGPVESADGLPPGFSPAMPLTSESE
jgi:hypothetical protein